MTDEEKAAYFDKIVMTKVDYGFKLKTTYGEILVFERIK